LSIAAWSRCREPCGFLPLHSNGGGFQPTCGFETAMNQPMAERSCAARRMLVWLKSLSVAAAELRKSARQLRLGRHGGRLWFSRSPNFYVESQSTTPPAKISQKNSSGCVISGRVRQFMLNRLLMAVSGKNAQQRVQPRLAWSASRMSCDLHLGLACGD